MATMTLAEIMEVCSVGRRRAEIYAKESGALLPRVKGGEYRVRRDAFMTWLKGGAR